MQHETWQETRLRPTCSRNGDPCSNPRPFRDSSRRFPNGSNPKPEDLENKSLTTKPLLAFGKYFDVEVCWRRRPSRIFFMGDRVTDLEGQSRSVSPGTRWEKVNAKTLTSSRIAPQGLWHLQEPIGPVCKETLSKDAEEAQPHPRKWKLNAWPFSTSFPRKISCESLGVPVTRPRMQG
jgi:hypothetical protein